MKGCEEVRARVVLYLDDELRGEEAELVEAHLEGCASCADRVEDERRFLEALRSQRPLHGAPAALRERIAAIVAEGAERASAPGARRLRWMRRAARRRTGFMAAAMAAVAVAGVAFLGALPGTRLAPATSEFAAVAVASHERYVRGGLPLELASTAPEAISAWFDGKVPFHLTLPNYREFSTTDIPVAEPAYRIEGARLVGFKGDYAAFVAYRMGERPISLLATSSTEAAPAGGEIVALKGLLFHHDTVDGLKVISWSHRGLTYALVSSLAEPGHRSCMVCHQGTPDRDFIEHSGPRG